MKIIRRLLGSTFFWVFLIAWLVVSLVGLLYALVQSAGEGKQKPARGEKGAIPEHSEKKKGVVTLSLEPFTNFLHVCRPSMFPAKQHLLLLKVNDRAALWPADYPFPVPGQDDTYAADLCLGDQVYDHENQLVAVTAITDLGEQPLLAYMGTDERPYYQACLVLQGTLVATADGYKRHRGAAPRRPHPLRRRRCSRTSPDSGMDRRLQSPRIESRNWQYNLGMTMTFKAGVGTFLASAAWNHRDE